LKASTENFVSVFSGTSKIVENVSNEPSSADKPVFQSRFWHLQAGHDAGTFTENIKYQFFVFRKMEAFIFHKYTQ
jgi:hypothetical protein